MARAHLHGDEIGGLAILDIDGTLTDTIEHHHAAMLGVMEGFSFPNLNRNWAEYRHHTDSAIFEEAWTRAGWREISAADHLNFSERFDRVFEQLRADFPIREIPGACRFVETLPRSGWGVAFATGGLRAPARIKLQIAGIPFAENLLVTASEYRTRTEIVTAAIEAASRHYGLTPRTVIALGDGIWDLETAAALGLDFLGVGSGAKAGSLAQRGARVVPDFRDLPAVFSALEF